MNLPPLTEEQHQQRMHLFAIASGRACTCARCRPPAPRIPSLVYQAEPFREDEVRRITPTLRARTVRGRR